MIKKRQFCTALAAAMLIATQLYADSYSTSSGISPAVPFVTPGGKPEGGAQIFITEASFQAAVAGAPKTLKFVESFEEASTLPMSVGLNFPAPLQSGVPAGDFPNGLAATNIQINCEDTGLDGGCDLISLGQGFLGLPSIALGASSFADTSVIETLPGERKTAIGFDIHDPGAGIPDYDLTVTDTSGVVLFSGTLIGVGAVDGFIGVLTDGAGIGSISVNGVGGGGELIDNIQLYSIPEPASALLLLSALGGVSLARRRK